MIAYEELIKKLRDNEDAAYRVFNAKVCMLPLERTVGVRVPVIRKIAKEYASLGKEGLDILCRFPDDLFEVTFVKCLAVAYAKLNFEELLRFLDIVVPRIDNWAICDCFTSTLKSVRKRRDEFLFYIEKCVADEREYVQRFAYVCLLDHYTVPEYFEQEFAFAERADCSKYYVHMAVAWLIAEILVKGFDAGAEYLKNSNLSAKTLNKAIQKARESYRLTDGQKNYLKTLKK